MRRAIVLLAAVTVLSPSLGLAGEAQNTGGAVDAATTIKGSKSNGDNRVGVGADAATSYNSGKSNSDNRVGAGAGGSGGGAERGTTVKGSKSNSSE